MILNIVLNIVISILLVFHGVKISRSVLLWISLLNYITSIYYWYRLNDVNMVIEEILGVIIIVDKLNIWFILLSDLLYVLCLLSIWRENNFSNYSGLILQVIVCVKIVFMVDNTLVFFIFFEGVLIPIYFIVYMQGSRLRRSRAVDYLFFYTFFGSMFMLLGVLLVYVEYGTLSMRMLELEINNVCLNDKLIWILFFIGFMVKIPLVPLHVWLTEAHVEAPTEGSVLLAGVLLKLGTYGYYKYCVILLGSCLDYYLPVVEVLCVLGIVNSSLYCLRETDVKKVIAYSSISHMSMVILGVSLSSVVGIEGSLLQMLGHGIVSSGLFFMIGMLYKRVGSKDMYYLGGVSEVMPLFSVLFLLLILGNIGFPGTVCFIGEFLMFMSVVEESMYLGVIFGLGVFLTGCYSIVLYSKVCFGNIKRSCVSVSDLSFRELSILICLICIMLICGICSEVVLKNM